MKRIAIVGCGGMGGGHAIAIGSGSGNAVWGADTSADQDPNICLDYEKDTDISKKLELAGVYDIDESRMDWARERGFHTFSSYEEILSDPKVDIVLIATPNHLHKDMSIQAMEAGKHVLCEKPVMMNSKDMKDVMEVSARTGKIFYPRQNRRWDKDYRIVKKIFEEKQLGNVFRIESRVHGSRGIPGDWRSKKQYGGGMMLDWGVHLLDRLLAMISEPVDHIYCKLLHVTNDQVDDGFTIYLSFKSGLDVVVEVGTCNFIALPLWYVAGDQGSAVIYDWMCRGEMKCLTSWEDKDAKPILAGAGLTKTMAPRNDQSLISQPLPEVVFDNNELYSNLVDTIEGNAKQIVTQEHALRVLELMEAAVESSETGKVIYV
ncbi:MAG TPA: Gfo/Idh/MocA family oxidoreductase [Candidatus Scybalocola faecavium]|nr:Gfo/Idh/MocA family oxidoreductase [Candidatus Scybalocola faecavium]